MQHESTSPLQIKPTKLTSEGQCFHCGDPVPTGSNYQILIDGSDKNMCCAGCQAVAQTIVEAGLEDYYTLRTTPAIRSQQRVPDFLHDAHLYTDAAVAENYVQNISAQNQLCTLLLQDLECSACCWLIERRLACLPGVLRVNLNYSNQRARIDFDPERIQLADILSAIGQLGYAAQPYDPKRSEVLLDRENRARLKRLGIAGLLGVQIMMLALALYSGKWWGMAPRMELFLRWISLAMAIPLVLYCAQPFFNNALRSLRNRSAGMDIPVSLGISIAFIASMAATLSGQGDVYFDSLAMFVFFLLLARYVEFVARKRGQQQREQRLHSPPEIATRIVPTGIETVPVSRLRLGDRLRILGGEMLPADGHIESGASSIDESLLSGESRPVTKAAGDKVIACSINLDQPFEMCVTALGKDRVIAKILELVNRAADEKPVLIQLADRIAGKFVLLILLLAALVAIYWLIRDPDLWLNATIAMLVVTCPCALSLATPTALSAASGALLNHGVIPANGLQIESLAAVNHVIFDKTGTLTRGEYRLLECRALSSIPVTQGLAVAAAMEAHTLHPLAKALRVESSAQPLNATQVKLHAGKGLEADVNGQHWWLGSATWVHHQCKTSAGLERAINMISDAHAVIVLADDQAPRFIFIFEDELRDSAPALIRSLQHAGIATSICSGDRPATVAALAKQLGITTHYADCQPTDKLDILKTLQRSGQRVAMLGDGVNDAPVLAGANVSFALRGGAQAALANADYILLSDSLPTLHQAILTARKARRIITQNLGWAVLYNLLAIPAAAAGLLAPWMAAIGMSVSSLLVVANSLRCRRSST